MGTSNGHNGVHHATDEAIDSLYAWMPLQAPAPAPLPEAALSLTLKGTLGGIEAMLTIRGQSPEEFKRHLESVKGLLDQPRPAPQSGPTPGQGQDWCAIHQVAMKQTTKNGQSWYSHKTADG
jgi:hypothetical protein